MPQTTGVLMQKGLHPDLKIEWYEDLFRSIKARYPIHLHCLSAPEVTNIAEVSGLSLRDTIQRLMDSGLDSISGGGAEILDDAVRHRINTPAREKAPGRTRSLRKPAAPRYWAVLSNGVTTANTKAPFGGPQTGAVPFSRRGPR